MDIDYKAIGKRVRLARDKKGITQEKLAELIGLSTPHMSHVETGSTKLGLPTIINIANALNVSVDELLSDNVIKSKVVFEKEAQEVFEDCTEYETRILVDIVQATKASLRKNKNLK